MNKGSNLGQVFVFTSRAVLPEARSAEALSGAEGEGALLVKM